MLKIILILIAILISKNYLHASNLFEETGAKYGISPKLLHSIATIESSKNIYLIAFNSTKTTTSQIIDLKNYLDSKNIKYVISPKIFTINNKNKKEAAYAAHYLFTNKIYFDSGLMQINSIHKELLDKANISIYDLFDPRINVEVGAYVLANCFYKHHNNIDAINCYNGKIQNNDYYKKVFIAFNK